MDNLLKEYFNDMFREIHFSEMDRYQNVTVEAGKQIVEAHEKIDKIWILLNGIVKAADEYTSGDKYIFREFLAPEVFGELEILSDIGEYRASLVTETKCYFITVSPEYYMDLLRKNPEYALKRLSSISKKTLNDERIYRSYLRIQGIDRLKLYLIKQYEVDKSQREFILSKSRQDIAEETGYSIRTVNRIIKQLKEEGFISVVGNKIKISRDQYDHMFKTIDEDNYF